MKKFISLCALAMMVLSCGSPKTLIRVKNNSEGTQTDISVQQGDGGSTSVNVSPKLSTVIDSVSFKIQRNAD